jgi:hypothetical protein
MDITANDFERFISFVSVTENCWLWIGAKDGKGYGIFGVRNTTIRAHRFSYEQLIGIVPKGYLVLHACNNPSCVRPDHLRLGTARANAIHRSMTRNTANTKLSLQNVAQIKMLLKQKGMTYREIGELFNVTPQAIYAIKVKRNYAWLDD